METASSQPITPHMEERKNPSFLAKYKFTIISLCIILLALVPLILISRNSKKPTGSLIQVQVTPTVTPLTKDNAVPTLDAVDAKIQTALDQSTTDIQAASQVGSSQDSTTGL